ncbi:alpha-2-macroglobulin-like protein 1, partial [Hypanus sabinus]|uniref:alpha-2-macroglobulin-like protein 1 n=1 Tax=Hypanus sabinus TaxID=79690 RepID=UPI0028C46BFD
VQLQFSSLDGLPGTPISIDLRAEPGSLCGLRVVDQSVLLLKPEKELTIDSIYSSLPMADLHQYHYQVMETNADFCPPDPQYWHHRQGQKTLFDVHQLLEGMGLKIFTDLDYHVPVDCHAFRWEYHHGAPGEFGMRVNTRLRLFSQSFPRVGAMPANHPGPGQGTPLPAEKVREYFPETWIWDLVPVSPAGRASLDVTIPDAITEWKGSAFCSGDAGFGLSPTTSLIAFKPFFVDLVLPYSVVRTEGFSLKAKIFNYMMDSLVVKVTLEEAEGFDLISNREHQLCVQSKDSVTPQLESHHLGPGQGEHHGAGRVCHLAHPVWERSHRRASPGSRRHRPQAAHHRARRLGGRVVAQLLDLSRREAAQREDPPPGARGRGGRVGQSLRHCAG